MRAKERFAKTDARFSDALKNRRHHSDEIMIDFVFVTSAWIFLPLLTFIITNARNSSGIVVYRINPPPRPWLLLCKNVLQSFHTSGVTMMANRQSLKSHHLIVDVIIMSYYFNFLLSLKQRLVRLKGHPG